MAKERDWLAGERAELLAERERLSQDAAAVREAAKGAAPAKGARKKGKG